MKKVNKKVWYAIGVLVVILIAWSMLRGGKKEEKVSFETIKVEKKNIHTPCTPGRLSHGSFLYQRSRHILPE